MLQARAKSSPDRFPVLVAVLVAALLLAQGVRVVQGAHGNAANWQAV